MPRHHNGEIQVIMQVIMGCLMRLGSFLLPTSGLKIMASQDNHFVQKKFADQFDWIHTQVTRKKKFISLCFKRTSIVFYHMFLLVRLVPSSNIYY